MDHRVVVTGIGIYSCLGENLDEVTKSLYAGKSGVVFDQVRKDFGFRSALTGMVQEPDLKNYLSRRQRLGMHQPAIYAYMATRQALELSGLDVDFLETTETGIIYGNDSTASSVVEAVDKAKEKHDTTLIGSGAIFQNMNSTVNMNLSTIFKLKGINFTLSAACASGSHSIGMGYMMIRQGLQDRIICGGAQEINIAAMASFDGLGTFSIRESEPAKASRPFDRDRDGLIPSGGAATVILESYESAVKRGAPILAELIGYGFSSNGDHISNPSIDGQVRSLKMAMTQAGIAADEVDYINAHATSTPVGDGSEARAIFEVFGPETPVSSTKSMTGHECWMAGASEIVYSLLMMQNSFVAPNINFENPDEDSARINVIAETKEQEINCFLSNSFGFGGTNSTLIIKKIS
ncbi:MULTISPECIES: beta-ketoacyl synthase [Dyadobacter]|uniref:3-oxoacyl-[acyl-carrier-protein] synthase 1 n=1 Tax=Dyadobacter chenhuakuii TaxID=2909339 RepID=A0ABY4XS46_9BACT|nr:MULTISPECIES: beta-ketoacyl-[acyl-carrier-protein] synthase family protein [Dyadobacter]MCF2492773.1 beta-ketoacyl-[acyl-carrier-protein] synthase family protein [Dyadobacter chenhuakuii]MCF2520836.1 beta-ketoacyl-[acyl-carrier-protein] synthase family protein [Dyadobacter sp. CY351]USJ32936.1 beta-ketoacyl-[acyl-carrier-protein] synthase family protein [Dyadobacter chenhuakuii]